MGMQGKRVFLIIHSDPTMSVTHRSKEQPVPATAMPIVSPIDADPIMLICLVIALVQSHLQQRARINEVGVHILVVGR